MSIKKVVIVTNVPNPYRIPLFNEIHSQLLGHGIELKVLFGSESYSRRKYKLNLAECSFTYGFLDSAKYNLGNVEKTLFSYKKIIPVLKAENPDCVIMSGFSLGTTRLWFYSLFHKVKYIIWSGTIICKGKNDSLLRRLQRKILASGASGFIAYGTSATKYLQSLGIKKENINIAINTVDTTFFRNETAKLRKDRIADAKFHLTYIGYLSARKNVTRLLEIVKDLKMTRNDFILDVVGDGDDKPNLEKFVQMNGLSEFVCFHGFRQKAEIPVYLAKSSCFLFQTDFDIWGLVLNEAMAAGLPCLSSANAGATIDLIKEGETGFVIDFANKSEAVRRISWVLDNPEEAKRIGEKAKSFIDKEASLHVSAAGFVKAIVRSLSV